MEIILLYHNNLIDNVIVITEMDMTIFLTYAEQNVQCNKQK